MHLANELVPVLCGSALRNKGVQPLLDAVVDYLPSPLDIPPIVGTDPDTEASSSASRASTSRSARSCSRSSPIRYAGRLAYLRVYSGQAEARRDHPTTRSRATSSGSSRLLRMYANRREDIDEVYAGDIVADGRLPRRFTGDTLCEHGSP